MALIDRQERIHESFYYFGKAHILPDEHLSIHLCLPSRTCLIAPKYEAHVYTYALLHFGSTIETRQATATRPRISAGMH
jgi:hypothetical protein